MHDLKGSAAQRLEQLAAVDSDAATTEWLTRQLELALAELAALEPIADAAREANEDY